MAKLTIPDEVTVATFTVTTPQDTFPFDFAIFGKADLRARIDAEDELDQADFSLTGTLLDGGGYQGGEVVLNAEIENCVLRVWRDVAAARPENFGNVNSVPVAAVDLALSRQMAVTQDLKRDQAAVIDALPLLADLPATVEQVFEARDQALEAAEAVPAIEAEVQALDASKAGVAGAGVSPLPFKAALNVWYLTFEDFNAVGDGVANDRLACQAAIEQAKLLKGATIRMKPGRNYRILGGDLIVHEGVYIEGELSLPGVPGANNSQLARIWTHLASRLIIDPAHTIRLRGGAGLVGLFVLRDGLTEQVNTDAPTGAEAAAIRDAAFVGTQITIEGEDTLLADLLCLGGEYVWRNGGNNRAIARNIRWDAREGWQSALSLDRSCLLDLHGWCFVTFGKGNQSSSANHANVRPGVAYRFTGTNDWLVATRLFDYGHTTGLLIEDHPNASSVLTIQLNDCGFDGPAFPESPWVVPGSKGIVVRGRADRVRIVGPTTAAKDLALDVAMTDPNCSIEIVTADAHGCRSGLKAGGGLVRLTGGTYRGLNGAYGNTISEGVGIETTGHGRVVMSPTTLIKGFAVAQKGNDLPGSFIGDPMIEDGTIEGIALHQVPIDTLTGTAQPSRDYDAQMIVGPPGASLGTLGPVRLGRIIAFYFYNETVVLAGGNIFVPEDTTYYAAFVLLLEFVGNGWQPLNGYVDPPDTPPDPVEPPVNLAAPTISGTPRVGSALTASQGSWNPPGVTYAYQWKVDGVNVGTNSNTYTPASGDLGKTVTVTVTATNPDGSASATSAATAAVSAASGPITDYDTFVAAMTGKAYSGSKGWTDEIGDFSGHCVTTVTGAPSGVMRGSSWGARAFEYQSVIARIIQHGLPSSTEMTAQVAGGFLIYFEYVRAYDYDSGELGYDRNGYPSVARGASEGIRLSKIIYWDGTTAKEMAPMSESGPTTYNHS